MSIADPAAYKAFDDRKPAAYCRRSKRSTEVCLEQVSVFGIFVIPALGFSLLLPLGVVGHEVSTVLVCLNGLRCGGRSSPFPGCRAKPLTHPNKGANDS
jgi:hypothetical protein